MECLRIEMRRALRSKEFCIALVIGIGIVLWHFGMNVVPKAVSNFNEDMYAILKTYPFSVYNSWIGIDRVSSQNNIYFNLVYFLIAIPFVSSYRWDRDSGYVKNIYSRCKRRSYLVAKWIAVFVSGGLVCVIPLVINLMLTMAVLPMAKPYACTMLFFVVEQDMCAELFYSHPMVYTIGYLAMNFVIAGGLCVMALGVSWIMNNRYLIMILPFAILQTWNTMAYFLGYYQYSLRNIAVQIGSASGYAAAIEIGILLVGAILVYWIGNRRKGGANEVL